MNLMGIQIQINEASDQQENGRERREEREEKNDQKTGLSPFP